MNGVWRSDEDQHKQRNNLKQIISKQRKKQTRSQLNEHAGL